MYRPVCDPLFLPPCVLHLLPLEPFCLSSRRPNNSNSLPLRIRSSDSLATFKFCLKSHRSSSPSRLGSHWYASASYTGGTAAAAPPPFRPSDPALCGSHPLVNSYYCRLGDLLCLFCVYPFVCHYCLCICVFICFRCFLSLL